MLTLVAINVLPLKVATATVSAYMLTLTFATRLVNMLTLNCKGCNCNVLVDTNVCNCFNGCKAKLSVYVLPLTVLTTLSFNVFVYVLSLTVLTATLSFNMLPRY